MEVTQIADIVNQTTAEVTGTEAIADVDLNKVVEVGAEVLDQDKLIDNYVKTLIDHIGKVVFVNRPYTGSTPSVMMDSWEYGAILEKIQYEGLPEAEDNDSWDLVDGQSYDPNVFHKPEVSAKFYSERRTFDVPMSFARRQVKSAFSNGSQVQAFFSMIETAISNGMTVKMDSLVQLTIANAIATVYNNRANHPVQASVRGNIFQCNPEPDAFGWERNRRSACVYQRHDTLYHACGGRQCNPDDVPGQYAHCRSWKLYRLVDYPKSGHDHQLL